MNQGVSVVKKHRWQFPSAYSVLFIVLLLAASLTYFVPAGKYSRLSYNNKEFIVKSATGEESVFPATQETLDNLNLKIELKQFTNGELSKSIALPGTYQSLDSNPTKISDFIMAPIEGVKEVIDIMLFVMLIGGIIGVLNYIGAINSGFVALSRITKGKEYILIILVTFLIAAGGTIFGMAEETVALYPILIPVFLVAGYDALVGVAAIYLGSSVGVMFSTVNPFSSIIASAAAGIVYTEGFVYRLLGLLVAVFITVIYILRYAKKVKANHSNSLIYEQKENIEKLMVDKNKIASSAPFTGIRALLILLFISTFAVMVWGVSSKDWWFDEMSALFLVVGIIICFISCLFLGVSEREVVNNFIAGASDLVGVGLIIGIARSVDILLKKGFISDTILYMSAQLVDGMSPVMFVIIMLMMFIVLGFFIPSTSALAVLSMPIMAPLADTMGLPRDIIVSAYQYGQGIMLFITPTGLILVALSLVHVTYNKWLRFVLPLMFIIIIFAALLLVLQVYLTQYI